MVADACAPPFAAPRESPAAIESPTSEASPSSTPTESEPPVSPSTAALSITGASFHTGEVSVGYAPVNLAAAGGVPPYSWQISSGFLPAGLQLSGNGVSGTPTSANTWNFTVRVLDSAGHSATAQRSITIARRMTASQLCPTSKPCQVEAGCVTVCGKFGSLTGGVAPYSYQLTSGQVPTGMSRNGLSLTGTFPAPATRSGTMTWLFTVTVTDSLGVKISVPADLPTGAGTFTFGLQVTDALGNRASTTGSIRVANYFSGNGICGGTPCTVEQGCVTACGAYAKPVGGVAPFSYKLTGGAVPTGTTLGWPVLTGTFTTASKYAFSVAVTDALGVTANVNAGYTVVPHIYLRGGTFTSTRYVPLSWPLPYTGGIGTPTATITAGKTTPPPVISATVDPAKFVVILTISTKDPVGTYSFYVTLTDQGVCGPGVGCASRAVVVITIQ